MAARVCPRRRCRRLRSTIRSWDRMVGASHEPAGAAAAETEALDALRSGDENAFLELVQQHQRAMLHLAMLYVPAREVAEEVVQETWLAVLQGLDRFEGRSSLK